MKLTKQQVEHVAMLARLGLSEAEIEKFQTQLSGILDYVELLNEVKTDGIQPTAQVTGLTNVMRADEVASPGSAKSLADADALLDCSPLLKVERQIKVKSVF
ncbi:MAG: Asp-tRNA(Asn)/Glu-tRNA(Gln) amidotransferase subunit GatC [Patescibacteria group bacterium]